MGMIYFKCPRCGQTYSEEELDKITNMTTEHYDNKCSIISYIKCSKCGYSDFNTYNVYPSDMWTSWINYELRGDDEIWELAEKVSKELF